jgi:hypothetical protein
MLSIYIPRVDSSIEKAEIARLLDFKFKLGIVSKIECIPRNGNEYNSCFVFFEKWFDGETAKNLIYRLHSNEQPRLYYNDSKYWIICINHSEVAYYKDPEHMDLILYLHPDFKKETIQSVVEGLDLGTVNSIEITKEQDTPFYEQNPLWSHLNKSVWDKKVDIKYITVRIHFDYWYRTKTAYAFQKYLENYGFIDIPVYDGILWTFYKEQPLLEGINPNVWKKI